jgi:acetyltransferase-like isoleucine patch superfamily enzyme
MKFIKLFLRNPIFSWFKWVLITLYYQKKYSKKNLSIGFMASFSNCKFGNYNTLYSGVALSNVIMGDFTYIAENSRLNNTDIGNFCCVGPEVVIGCGKHPTRDFVSIHPIFFSQNRQAQITFVADTYYREFEEIKIGNDVWIGMRAIILDGVTVGDGAIIGAGALVTKDVPAYAVVGGIPAKVLRYRFDSSDIEFLLRTKWWERDVNWLKENALNFQDINKLKELSY